MGNEERVQHRSFDWHDEETREKIDKESLPKGTGGMLELTLPREPAFRLRPLFGVGDCRAVSCRSATDAIVAIWGVDAVEPKLSDVDMGSSW